MKHYLTHDEVRRSFRVPDERMAALPLVSAHEHPQVGPQEYECGCITVEWVTDRGGDCPFEMRLAVACETTACERTASQERDL